MNKKLYVPTYAEVSEAVNESGLSQSQIAKRSGLARQTVWKVAHKRGEDLELDVAKRILEAIDNASA